MLQHRHKKPIIVLILAGGKGERFWPRSTSANPKQVQKIYSEQTLLEETYNRALLLTTPDLIFLGCNPKLQKIIQKKHPHLFKKKSFIVEPEGRNTAAIIAWASLLLNERYPDSIQIVLPADHYIHPIESFVSCIETAIQTAEKNYLVTLGIEPARPDNQYGYIQAGEKIGASLPDEAQYIQSFTEKPNIETAQKYLQTGNYYWNSGVFIWPTSLILEEFNKYAKEIIMPLTKALVKKKTLAQHFSQVPKLPIDIAILEKSSCLAMIPAKFRWDDLGSWTSLARVLKADKNNNFSMSSPQKHLLTQSSKNNIVAGKDGLIALLGVNDLIIVQEGDTLLLAHRDAVGDIKNFLDELRKNPSLQKYAP